MLDRESDPRFSQPIRQILSMLVVLGLLIAGVVAIYVPVRVVFESNLALTGFIAVVFVIGVLACFWQVYQLTSAVSWIEGFALDRPGHEFTRAPQLLASLSALLRGKDARRQLTATSTRSILDSVAQRIDEARDITRYISNVLIFLGLLGTFWGLSLTMPKVVEVIQSLKPVAGETGVAVFDRLMSGLEGQLEGIGTAFSASLVGLAGSLVVGLLDLFVGHGQNRFYRELEDWLSSITRLSLASGDAGDAGGGSSVIAGVLEQTALQIESFKEITLRAEEKRLETDEKLGLLTEAVATLVHQLAGQKPGTPAAAGPDLVPLLERIAAAQERLAATMKERDEDAGQLDAETRMRLKNIDVQLLRILEEMAAGRQDSVAEIRTELSTLTRTIASAVQRTAER
jgi:hypothetical protein